MNHEDPVERAIHLLEHIQDWPDALFAHLDTADHQAIVKMLDLLNDLSTLLVPPPAELTDPQRDMLDHLADQLEEHVQRFDRLLPAKPDAGAAQGHLEGAFLEDLDYVRSHAAGSRSWSDAYVHNTLLDCREKLLKALHEQPDHLPPGRPSGGTEPGAGSERSEREG